MSDTPDISITGQASPAPNRQARPPKPRVMQQQQPRAVNPVLEKLFELYPQLFGTQFLPLKLGVFHELVARHPDDFKKDELKIAMGQHARSTRYLESVANGHQRHDLAGNPVEAVAPEHVHHAILEVFRRKQARAREDLRPRLKLRLMDAIESSGLSLEDYAERMRVQDEVANAVLDAALADLKMEAAKREALARTFDASGKTVEEFCDMYGMDPAEVTRVLSRVRDDEAARAVLTASRASAPVTVGHDQAAETADTPDAPEAVVDESQAAEPKAATAP